MIKKEIRKKKIITPLVKANRASNPSGKKISKIISQRKEIKIPKNKSRVRSTSVVTKGEPKKELLNLNHSFKKNSLELDYLNFSQLDLFKLNESFEEDIFTPNYKLNNPNNNKKIILNRYEDSNSTINDYSNIINNNLNDELINTEIIKDKKNLINTPSTICNYYEASSNKTKNEVSKNNFPSDMIKKNLDHYYNINNLNNKENKNDEKDCYNIIKKKKEFNQNNIKKNNILNLMNVIINPDKMIKNNQKLPKDEVKNKDYMKFYSNNAKINKIKFNNLNENIKTIDYNFPDNKINVNLLNEKPKIRIGSKEKQINYYHNQNKNDGFFITPRNINKTKNENSTKSTKINTQSIGKAKSFSSKKINKTKYSNNKMYINNNKINNNLTNYKIIKELIKDNKDIMTNKHKLNKTTPKTKNTKNLKNNSKNIIKVNIKSKNKSSSNINTLKKQIISEENKIFNAFNNNNINNKIKSEIKSSFVIFQNIYKTINKSGIKSPDKDDNNNLFKVSKTLTENNILHKMQATPKNYKIQKFDSIPFTTIVKKIFIGSSKKDNLMKFDSSMKKREKTKTEQMKCIFKPKTQSDFKPYNNIVGNEFFKKSGINGNGNGEYGNDRHVKQKLLDRMNKATNNWNYIFKANKNKKVLDDGISNLKSQNKEYNNYFYKNENIISDGSEKEDEGNL